MNTLTVAKRTTRSGLRICGLLVAADKACNLRQRVYRQTALVEGGDDRHYVVDRVRPTRCYWRKVRKPFDMPVLLQMGQMACDAMSDSTHRCAS